MDIDIKQVEGRKKFDEEFSRHMKKVTVGDHEIDWMDD